jgi:hypothetical protein
MVKSKSLEIDTYIDDAAEFAQPILEKLRGLFHKACPVIEETIKWKMPHFVRNGIVGHMAAFKKHVNIGFWQGNLMSDPENLFEVVGKTSMTIAKFTDRLELPSDKILLTYIREAVILDKQHSIAAPKQTVKKKSKKKVKLETPEFLIAALRKNKRAQATFEDFSYSHKKEYVEWLTDAKQDSTRNKRLATAIEWMAEGKSKNWKYLKKK